VEAEVAGMVVLAVWSRMVRSSVMVWWRGVEVEVVGVYRWWHVRRW
jgi:hypothetical protein